MTSDGTPSYWVHDLNPFLVRFTDSLGIRYYGLAYVFAFLIAGFLLHCYWRAKRSPLNPKVQSDLMIGVVIGVLLGGRLGYFLLYSPVTLWREPLALLRVRDGGMSSHGGFVGVCLALVWLVRKHKLAWRSTADILVTLAPPGLFLGRVANFINGELWGKVAYVPWAVIFPKSAPDGTPVTEIPPRHPSQLYEAVLEGLFLTIYTQLRFWRSPVTRERPGQLAGEFLILYAVVRAIGEVFREPDASLLFGLSRGTFYSLFLVIGGLILLGMSRHKPHNSTEKPGG
ncbi:MAG TPA: prolipoprotein diacylglyceryl transferase [Candidatus Limnocylindrales bacterium]|nr:prolipoprotein diacylglyceryl transferase [Candidatus Limnocylindrales bacterium]